MGNPIPIRFFLIITDFGDMSVSLPMNPKLKDYEANFRGT